MAPMPRQSISGRPSRSHHKSSMKAPRHVVGSPEEPPHKKRRYVPGGPGGGGRFVELDAAAVASPTAQENTPKKKNGTPRRHSNNARSRPAREIEQSLYAPPPPPPIPTTPPSMTRPRRDKSQNRGRFTSSTAAALALQQGDADEVDAADAPPNSANPDSVSGALESLGSPIQTSTDVTPLPFKRRPGRPPRRPEALLNAIRFQPGPKVIPPPGPNPREKLTLPKPAFRLQDPFTFYEQKGGGQQNYVDRTMASVGYQESDVFLRHDRRFIRMTEGAQEDDMDVIQPAAVDNDINSTVGRVEYDMDEQDEKWLDDINAKRRDDQLEPIKPAIFEITMTKIEKEWHALEKRIPKPNPKPPQTQRPRSSSAAAVNGETVGPGEEQDSKCAICDDGDCENSNAIVFCDGCDLAVHQECYGVPFIPEGQWLCRKCQLLGRGTTNCIFCPNTEGAFKQTTSSKWAHLLCSFWIPEVSIGNPSLMEPVTDVEKVPRGRWKLLCYICKQKMGASIQCSNKNCFVAFHVSCARRAQLYLKMKIGHGLMDSHLLKAFCDKHVPPDWRLEHGTDAATADAIEYYRNTMQGRRWGDSQAAALSLAPSHAEEGEEECLHTPRITLTVGGNKRKRAARTIWKLPSGAPVIPQVVLNSVVASLGRFTVRGRKQYAEEACKYWTLKREARRGAALLKRLQLQLETFSSMEMTRRDYVAMGVTGHKRLQRRIEFGEHLYKDLDRLRMLCDEVKKREREKLKDAEMLRSIVDLVYFPIFPLLWPVFEKAQVLDGKAVFAAGLMSIRKRLQERFYPSVASFSADLASLFTSEIGVGPAGDTAQLQEQISGRAPELSVEQREKRKLAKRIIKSIQPALEDAIRKESELNRKPYEKELKELDVILDHSVMSRRGDSAEVEGDTELGIDPEDHKVEAMEGVEAIDNHDQMSTAPPADEVVPSRELATEDVVAQASVFEDETKPNINVITKRHPTPVLIGTTIHEERWTGRDVMRGMSEELSELDEDELKDLVDDELPDTVNTSADNPGRSKQNVRRTRRSRR
ncbi:hypothetical protein N7470_003049 [Penicillium chermesinum]|nr:hypothetical protein N7470_003049 [Penicillium chermesinum]